MSEVGSPPDARERVLIRKASIAGGVAMLPWLVAAVGWAAHWNALINLFLTLAGFVLWFTLIACTLDSYQRDARG